jgi:putative membrane protein insertion efficiency factor
LKPTTAPSSAGGSEASADSTPPSAVARALLLLIKAYKLLFSPLFAGSCRFVPSCANYTAEAIGRHGAVRGSLLGIRRLARCQPFCRAGYDPVPNHLERGWLFERRHAHLGSEVR